MFGYVVINKPEMKFKDYDIYKSYYCGLCKTIKKRHGFFAGLSVNYDFTFLAILFSSLYEPKTVSCSSRCIVHPISRHKYNTNFYLEYCSDMNVYLTYLKCIDDWHDEKKLSRLLYAKLLQKKAQKIENMHSKRTEKIKQKMAELSKLEEESCDNIDKISGAFGEIMKEIFCVSNDIFDEALKNTGFYLGKFIYLLDAYEDLYEDNKNGCYNPLKYYYEKEDYEAFVRSILISMMAECCKSFEFLPIVENLEILRNILYSGVWIKYTQRASRISERLACKNKV